MHSEGQKSRAGNWSALRSSNLFSDYRTVNRTVEYSFRSVRKMGTGAFLEMSIREVSISYPGSLAQDHRQGHVSSPFKIARGFRIIQQVGQPTANVLCCLSKATSVESTPVHKLS
jgi:hypothetical protein